MGSTYKNNFSKLHDFRFDPPALVTANSGASELVFVNGDTIVIDT